MSTLKLCLERCLASANKADPTPLVVVVGRDEPSAVYPEGFFERPIPTGWRRQEVSFDELPDWTPDPDEKRLLLVGPFVRVGELAKVRALDAERRRAPPDVLAGDGRRRSLALTAAVLLRAASHARPGQRLAAVLPDSAFAGSDSEPREALLRDADLVLLAEGGNAWSQELGLHGAFRLALLCVERRAEGSQAQPSRFIRLPRHPDPDELARELRHLFKQQGGGTQHGYVLREPVEARRLLQVAAHDPTRLERLQHLRSLGKVQRLAALAEVFPGRDRPLALGEREPKDGLPLLSGKDISSNISRDDPGMRRAYVPAPRSSLAVGDICLPSIGSSEGRPLRVRVIEEDELPMAASHTVLVIRPKVSLDEQTMEFLLDYLRSPRAAALLRHETTGGPHLKPSQLSELPVPWPDPTLLSALADLRETELQLRTWAAEVETAKGAVLGEDAAEAGLLELRSAGQLLRQRVTAARQLDDLGYRVRNLFPFPVALPWRRTQTAPRDLEGYQSILESAESLTAYLAVLSILLARSLDRSLGAVDAIRKKLATTPHGVSMSDWTEVVREVAGRDLTKAATAITPFVELTELMTPGGDAYEALRELTDMRNEHSHNRGPKGAQVPRAFADAFERLEELYRACEWLIDYPIRLVDDTAWDSHRGSGEYSFRELIGDHYLVQQRTAETLDPTLNKGRLYVVDRADAMHLVSPLILWHECDFCHVPSAFALDAFDRKARSCRMRAMDHNHVIQRTDVVGPLASYGLVPE